MSIFSEQVARKPDLYPWTAAFMQAMWDGHWTASEFSFEKDKHDYLVEMTPAERGVVTRTLSAISQIEVAVKTYWSRLGDHLPHPSLSDLGMVMAGVEAIHGVAYSKLLSVLGLEGVFQENLGLPVIAGRVKYLRKYNERCYKDDRKQFVYSLILFSIFVENVSLFSQFYVVLWLGKEKNWLSNTCNMVKYTKNEETVHAMCGMRIVEAIRAEHPELFDADLTARVRAEAACAVDAEAALIDWMLGGYEGPGLTAALLKEFVKARADASLVQMGFGAVFAPDPALVAETLWFTEQLYGQFATDFFSSKPVDYSKSAQAVTADDLFA